MRDPRCVHLSPGGRRCQAQCRRDSDYCAVHNPERSRCKAFRMDGMPCANPCARGTKFCSKHDPKGRFQKLTPLRNAMGTLRLFQRLRLKTHSPPESVEELDRAIQEQEALVAEVRESLSGILERP
jgi:hypothetical protein